jgi:MATE family multidrug resistance protein
LSILFALLITPLFFFFEPIFLAIGQDAEVARLAGQYMPYLGAGLLPALMMQVLKNYLTALELARSILYAAAAAALFNAGVNYLLIFGNFGLPELGIVGAGVASCLSHLLGLVLLVAYALWKRPDHELFRNFQRPDPEALRAVFRVGLPIGLTLLAETGLFAASGVMMGWLGPVPLAAHGIALSLASITFMVPLGLSQALTVRVGRAQGTGDREALQNAAMAGLALAGVAALMTMAAFLLLPEALIGLYVDPNDPARPEILAVGVALLAVAALFQLVDFGQVVALGMLRGVQDTRVPMVIAAISYWVVGLPVAWMGLTCGLACACVLLLHRFWRLSGRVL